MGVSSGSNFKQRTRHREERSDDPSPLAAQAPQGWESAEAPCAKAEAIHRAAPRKNGLLRGACHRARIRATRWLAMTENIRSRSRGMTYPGFACSWSLGTAEGAGEA